MNYTFLYLQKMLRLTNPGELFVFDEEVKKVEFLDLSKNRTLKEIQFKEPQDNLIFLDASYCAIEHLVIKDCPKLQTLYLNNNPLKTIRFEGKFQCLEMIILDRNLLTELDIQTENFPVLKHMYLYENKLLNLSNLSGFFIREDFNFNIEANENLTNPPVEIVKQGKAAIKKYFEELKKAPEQYNFEVKLMLIGEGGTGKTSLLKKLMNKDSELPDASDTTLGIDIRKWEYSLNKLLFGHLSSLKQDKMLVNIWDLGGQKIYHGTHQIFFREDTFYVLVEETRDHKTDFSYWFNTLEQLAGEKANLLVVINEKFGHVYKFDADGFKTRFGFVKELCNVDLSRKDQSITGLQEDIKHALQRLPIVGNPLPASYIRVKEELFKRKENFISLEEFRKICEKHDITDFNSVEVLSRYLDGIGVVTHFWDDEILRNRVFLNSEWLVKTVYKVLDSPTIKEKKGRISKEVVYQIWHNENLSFEINNLTQLMNKFGLMYKVKEKEEYVIPEHLPTEKPYTVWQHQDDGNLLIFRYEFGKYMPEGLMSHLIVSLNRYIENETLVWHRGVNVNYENSCAEIIETYGEINTFEIKITGSRKRDLLSIIRHSFADITKPFKKLYFKELIPCNCSECIESKAPYFYIYKNLLKRLDKNIFKVQCEKSYEEIDVKKLIDDVILEEKVGRYVMEKLHQQQILDLLIEKKLFIEKELITTYDSNKEFALQEQIKELEKQIEELKKKI